MTNADQFFKRREHHLNIDISFRCSLKCLRCARQNHYTRHNLPVPGHDMSLEVFSQLVEHFPAISFCGQYSDPIHHPEFVEFLKICATKSINTQVHVASSARSQEWFRKAFNAHPEAEWFFGLDGMPADSHKYRVNQDGPKLFKIMLEAKHYLRKRPVWKYIRFSYNENDLDEALQVAKENGIDIFIVDTGRWWSKDDWLRPSARML